MKPLKLTLEAYGTFLHKTEIDFTVLNEQGLYLITGPTGSGKTTIFDGIVFALYGEASGDNRDASMLRSDFAPKDVKTYVRLEFSIEGKKYIVERSPKYSVPGRVTPLEAKASLIMPNGEVIEKVKNVNDKITELLGLTANQFRQIIMLAQGEFMKLIYADSKDKDEIFRKLFKTDALKSLELKLKDSLSAANKDTSIKEGLITDNLKDFEEFNEYEHVMADYSFIPELIEEAKQKLDDTNKELKDKVALQKQNEESLLSASKNLAKAEQQNSQVRMKNLAITSLEALIKEEPEIEKLRNDLEYISKLEKVKPLYDKYTSYEAQKDETYSIQKEKAVEYEEAKNESDMYLDQTNMIELDRASLENAKKCLDALKKDYEVLKSIEEKKEIAAKQALNKEKFEKELVSLNSNIDSLDKEIATLTQTQEKVNSSKLEKVKLVATISDLKTKLEKNEFKLDMYNRYQNEQQQIEAEKIKYNGLKDIYANKYTSFDEIQKLYYLSSAALLARDLKEGEPCPVCGSTHHPVLAKAEKEVSKKDLEKVQAELDLAKDNLAKQEGIVTERSNKNIELAKDMEEKLGGTNFLEIINAEKDELSKQYSDVDNKLNEIKEFIENNQNIDELLSNVTSSKEELSKQIEQAKLDLASCISSIKTINADINNLQAGIGNNDSLEDVNEKILDHQEVVDAFSEAIGEFDKGKQEADARTKEILSALSVLNKQLTDITAKYTKAKSDYDELAFDLGLGDNLDFDLIQEAKDISRKISTHETTLSEKKKLVESLSEVPTSIQSTDHFEFVIDECTKTKDNLINEIDNLKIYTKNLDSNINKLSKNYTKYQDSYEKKNALTKLANTSSGKNSLHLSFERFVLIDYFDNILKLANKRLSAITNGRYLLNRKELTTSGAGQQGLDIEIFDYETGKYRDVKSLSGGETFKASLSLALGLADAIEENAGGISIECLFIDEGFGSLDKESLFQALNTLIELKGDNKTIGIISHVAELKELIDTTVVVEKDTVGSKVSIKVK